MQSAKMKRVDKDFGQSLEDEKSLRQAFLALF